MSIDHLRAYWGLTRMPFTKHLAPSMLSATSAHSEAVARIGWRIQESAIGVLTGEVGVGKAVAIRAAVSSLDLSRYTIICIGNPSVGARGIYTTIITTLGATPRFQKAALIPQTQGLLAVEYDERGEHVVLIVDEAHLLSTVQLEELRLLTNADTSVSCGLGPI